MKKEEIRKALSSEEDKRNFQQKSFSPASVLIPLIEHDRDLFILFTKRSKHVKNHEEEVSFPGGALEEGETPKKAALRETEEEIGISPDEVEILGKSPSVKTWTSGYVIFPHVGYINSYSNVKINECEVQDIFEVPITFLQKENRKFEASQDFINESYEYENYTIWGATARILYRFLDLVYS